MSSDTPDHQLSSSSTVALMLGNHPVHILDTRVGSCDSLLNEILSSQSEPVIVLGLHLSPARELIRICKRLLLFGHPDLGGIQKTIANSEWDLDSAIAVFPNVYSVRFCFPYDCDHAHRFLIEQILSPRNYSLNAKTRWLLKIYGILLSIIPRPTFLYQAVYIRIHRE